MWHVERLQEVDANILWICHFCLYVWIAFKLRVLTLVAIGANYPTKNVFWVYATRDWATVGKFHGVGFSTETVATLSKQGQGRFRFMTNALMEVVWITAHIFFLSKT